MSEIHVKPKPLTPRNWMMIVAGSALYALSVNLFLNPLSLFAGGIVGTAQLVRNLLVSSSVSFDVAGMLNLAFNMPLFVLAYRHMAKKTFYGTVVSLIVQTAILSFLPTPSAPLIADTLAGIMISGILGGIGVGFSAQYGWQAVFNTFGALAIAAETYGLQGAVSLRVIQNVFGVVFALAFCVIFYWFMSKKKESDVTVHAE